MMNDKAISDLIADAPMDTLYECALKTLPLRSRGKVRDIFDIDDRHCLIVTTDRLSAFDVILPDPIPDKGRVLTSVSGFWFRKLNGMIANHLTDLALDAVVPDPAERKPLVGRSMIVKRYRPLPVEAVVRGYLIGSGWKDYLACGSVCGIPLPRGLRLAEQLPEPIYTPSTKAEAGTHDANIDFDETIRLLGKRLAEQVRDVSLSLYRSAASYACQRGIIIADTKFEFGLDDHGVLHWIDEALTPDSSRFWPADQYHVGLSPPSFDKQFVRDYLETLDWDKQAPGPALPANIIEMTSAKYREAEQRLLGN